MLASTCRARRYSRLFDSEIESVFISPVPSDYCELYNAQIYNVKAFLSRIAALPDCILKNDRFLINIGGDSHEAITIWKGDWSICLLLDLNTLVVVNRSGVAESVINLEMINCESDRMCVNDRLYLHDLYDAIYAKRYVYPFRIDEDCPDKSPKFY